MSLAETTVIVFARAPIPGRCKTRLIPQYGAAGAARLHRRLTLRTLGLACASGAAQIELWCEPSSHHGFFHRCRRRFGTELRSQPRGDLGRKMALALQSTLARSVRQVLIVGTDCAALSVDDLRSAAAALRAGADCVLQPAEDGGYVLIGARRVANAALRGIAWSSGRELAQTRTRLRRLELSWRELLTRWDVDLPRDVRRARRAGLL